MIELFKSIQLDKESKTSLYLQLFNCLKELIQDGTLPPDLKLPSVRKLSEALKINQITVVSAFKQLEKEGFAYSKPGSGTYVANSLQAVPESLPTTFLDELYQNDDISVINNDRIKISDQTINFASATPTSDLFPVKDFKLVLNEVLDRDKGSAFGYQDSQGFYPLRESIAEILKRSSIHCNPENIQIISGAQQGIDIISKAFLSQGDYVITESPTYTGAIAVFKSRGAQIADVQMEKDGLNLNILEYTLQKFKPKLIYTIPSFQNPTGCSYSNYKRAEIVRLAEKYGAYIIEDDYVSDLDFENRGFSPLKALDFNHRVIYIKSFSKIFMPGLRLGFMIVPQKLKQQTIEAKHTTDISTSGLTQRAFDLYIREGYWDQHFNFMFDIYKERYFETIHALDGHLPKEVTYSKPGGGLNIWLDMPYGFPVNNLLKHASSNDVVFAPGRIFYSGNCPQSINNIRLSFAAVYTDQIKCGVEKLCAMIASLLDGKDLYQSIRIL
ncbi:MAG: PLP-dependent aminotransferase family protein [Clostridia bacterium]|nr:PLP-dependent aminotransferase family protein [Clostridia bacterium]